MNVYRLIPNDTQPFARESLGSPDPLVQGFQTVNELATQGIEWLKTAKVNRPLGAIPEQFAKGVSRSWAAAVRMCSVKALSREVR